MSRFWSSRVHSLHPYTPGEQPKGSDLLKLNTNESPFPPSDRVLDAIRSTTGTQLLRYPDPNATELKQALADAVGLSPDQVFLGNGSDEVLAHVFHGLLARGSGRLLLPDISYSFYPVWCQLYQLAFEQVPLRDDFSIGIEDYAGDAASVLLANPNAPTGVALPLSAIRRLVEASSDRLVVIDEAYIDYGAQSAVPLIKEFDNLLVVQTLSKSRALAGMRIGMAFGQLPLIAGLERVKDSFNSYPLDVLAQRAGVAAVQDKSWLEESRSAVVRLRSQLSSDLETLGFRVLPSQGNFVFVEHKDKAGKDLFDQLREQGIIVRRWDKPRIENFLRISVGTQEQMQRLVAALSSIVAGH
ncbi:MAG: histidinol-phosphate transaminase [Pseudomonadota bacterium]